MDETGAELHLNDSVSLRVRQVTTDIADVNLVGLFCVRVVVHAWGVAVVVGGREVGPHRDLAARVNDHRRFFQSQSQLSLSTLDSVKNCTRPSSIKRAQASIIPKS